MLEPNVDESEKQTNHQRRRRRQKKKPQEVADKGPKDTKVVLVDPNQFSLLKSDTTVKPRKNNSMPLILTNFPELDAGVKPELPINSPWYTRKWKDSFPKLGELADSSVQATFVGQSAQQSEKTFEQDLVEISRPDVEASIGKMKRSRRPISLDLSSIIKAKNKHKIPHANLNKRRKSKNSEVLSGNVLDSSMPIRKRGKVRETKKIKLSRMKEAIIKDRIVKVLMRKMSNIDEIDLKKELENYLVAPKVASIPKKANEVVENISQKPVSQNKFNNKFRSYCENVLTTELNAAVKEFIQNLVSLQDRAFARDPVRARARKRYVVGFREAAKYLKLKSVKLLIIAPDLEASTSDGALSSFIHGLKEEAKKDNVPCIFALDRRKIGYCSLRGVPVSAFAVLIYEGLETLFESVMCKHAQARKIFLQNYCECAQTESSTDSNDVSQLLANLSVKTEEEEKIIKN